MVGGETGRISTTPMIGGIGTGKSMRSKCPVNVTQVRNRQTLPNDPPSKARLTLARSAPFANMVSRMNVIGIRIMRQAFASRLSRAFLTIFAVRCRALQSSINLQSPHRRMVPCPSEKIHNLIRCGTILTFGPRGSHPSRSVRLDCPQNSQVSWQRQLVRRPQQRPSASGRPLLRFLRAPVLPFSKPQKRGTATGNDLTTTPGGKTRAAGDRIKRLCVARVIKRDHGSTTAIFSTPIDLLLVRKLTKALSRGHRHPTTMIDRRAHHIEAGRGHSSRALVAVTGASAPSETIPPAILKAVAVVRETPTTATAIAHFCLFRPMPARHRPRAEHLAGGPALPVRWAKRVNAGPCRAPRSFPAAPTNPTSLLLVQSS